MTNVLLRAIGAAGLLLASAAASQAASYNFDISDKQGTPSAAYAAAGDAGIWNATSFTSATNTGFTDVTGTIGGVSVTVTITGGSLAGSNGTASTDFLRLVNDNFYSSGGAPWTVAITGLVDGLYDLHLYASPHAAVPLGAGTANGISFASISGGSVLTAGLSYLTLEDVLVAGGTLTVSAQAAAGNAGLTGMQLVGAVADVPLPAGGLLLLSGLGLAGIAARRKRV